MSGGVVEVGEMMRQFEELYSSIGDDDLLSEVTSKLNAMRIIQDEITKKMGNMISDRLKHTFKNEVKSRKPELCEFELCDKYMRATSYPYEIYPKSTLGTTGRCIMPHYTNDYPKIRYTTDDNKDCSMGYHTMVATCVLNDGEKIDQDTYDVDHIHQDRFNWNVDDLEIVDKQTNQRNRGSAQWIDEALIGSDVVAMDQYLDNGKIIDISSECIYRADIQGQLTYFTWESNGKYRRCSYANGRIKSKYSKKSYNINRLYSTEEETDDEEMFSQ